MSKLLMVSLIVPVYNVQSYIEATLQSLIDQTYLNWQAIVVDDGSTDQSLAICKRFESKDARIHVYTKTNGGLSDARNYGLTRADGDLISFLDGDDILHPQFLEEMVKPFEDLDVTITGCEFGYDLKSFEQLSNVSVIVMDKDTTIDLYLVNDRSCEESVCNKVFRKTLFENIRFPIGKIHEDTFVLIDLLLMAQKYAFVDFKGYNVVSRSGSITRSAFKLNEFDKVEACKRIVDKLRNTSHFKKAFNKYLGSLLWFILKTNGRIDNQKAYDALKAIPLRRYCSASLRFIPFLIAYRCRLLPYLKVK